MVTKCWKLGSEGGGGGGGLSLSSEKRERIMMVYLLWLQSVGS